MQQTTVAFLGNQTIQGQLARITRNSRNLSTGLSASYIFAGSAYSGKREAALWYARAILCSASRSGEPCGVCPACRQAGSGAHPDLIWLRRAEDKKTIAIDDVRALIDRLSRGAFLGGHQLAIIEGAEYLNEEGANALLKTLEEPNARTIVIMLTDEPEKIIRTIVSRSQLFVFRAVPELELVKYLEDNGVRRKEASDIARLSLRKARLARLWADNGQLYQDRLNLAQVFLSSLAQPASTAIIAVGELLASTSGQEASRLARNILDAWSLTARDLLLQTSGVDELLSHLALIPEIKQASQKITQQQALKMAQNIKAGYAQLEANVAPRAVLENVLIGVNF